MKTTHKHWFALTASTLGLTGLSLASGFGDEKYTYDASGNLTEKTIGNQTTKMAYLGNRLLSTTDADTKVTLTYDEGGRPIAIGNRKMAYGYGDKVLSAETAGKKTDLFYNSEGNLIAKITNGQSSTYTWDGISLTAQDGRAFTNEIHIAGGVPVLQDDQDVVISDYLGNTLVAGEQHYTNTAYGEGQEDARFTSKPFIKELDSFVFPHRLYSASKAKWSTVDPLGYPDGNNNTEYVNSDPTSNVDPLGLLGAAAVTTKPNTGWTWKTSGNVIMSFATDQYEVTCDDGVTKVFCYKPKADVVAPSNTYDFSHNCHGHALSGGAYLIPPEALASIKTGDKWKTVAEHNMTFSGSYVARYVDDHSAIVTNKTPGPTISVTEVTGKAGLMAGLKATAPGAQWDSTIQYGPVSEYWEK